jgi:predicted enzyme related to lactoylglutathione lyase
MFPPIHTKERFYMEKELKIKYYATVIDCLSPRALARFYGEFLSWSVVFEDDDYTVIAAPGVEHGAYPALTFQKNVDYTPPVWPEAPNAQQQMEHIDFAVNAPELAKTRAVSLGAKIADKQFSEEWTVMIDPEGHPFCLLNMGFLF